VSDSAGAAVERVAAAPQGPVAEERVERLLLTLMGARLALSLAGLGIGLGLEAIGASVVVEEWRGFYGAVAAAFVLTIVYRLFAGRVKRPRGFAAVNIATDIGLVSALVLFSGGRESVFIFLYVGVAVYAAALFRRFGAIACGALAAVAYGAVLVASQHGWAPAVAPEPLPVVLTSWTVHAGALVLVSALTSFLATELDRTGEALRQRTSDLVELQSLYRHTVDSLMSGVLTADLEGRVTSFNPEAERITGLPGERARGMGLDEVLPGIHELIALGAGAGDPRMRARMTYRSRRGQDLHLGVGAYALRDAEGRRSGHVVIFQDLSDVVAMERELRRSERLAAVGELSASIAHEIRNPLASISGSIEVMRSRLGPGRDETGRLMEIVVREVERLDQLITDFLLFARPGPAQPEPVAVAEAAAEVMEMFEPVRPRGVETSIQVLPGLAVHADPGQLRQVVWNLVLNASQAMPEGGRLRVEGTLCGGEPAQGELSGRRMEGDEKPSWAEIAVMDEGVGIPAEALERVFDPFFTTRRGGSGLGLATVHRIVVEHGGSVRVEQGVGSWSTVIRVRLPRAETPA
jgi:two-component system, NtrC family, sensor histidine kinase PilS